MKLVPALLLVVGLVGWSVQAIDSECSACEAVAGELQKRLDAEHKRTHIDMRHRLDKDGNRYGKIINYRVSEQRAVNLLDDLCQVMDEYTLVGAEDVPGSSSSSSDASSKPAAAEDSNKTSAGSRERVWVKFMGQGKMDIPRSKRPSRAEEELRGKQLKAWCGMLLENHEEQVVEALAKDQFTVEGTAPVLCQQITHKCKGKVYALPDTPTDTASSSASDQKEL